MRFWPDPKYFDSNKFSVSRLLHVLKAKAVLCPGLTMKFEDKVNEQSYSWCYIAGIRDYLIDAVKEMTALPETPFTGNFAASHEAVEWAVLWLPDGGELVTESYVKLHPNRPGRHSYQWLAPGLAGRAARVL